MDVKLVAAETVQLMGTREEFGFVNDSAEIFAAAKRADAVLGRSESETPQDLCDSIGYRLNVTPMSKVS